MEASEQLRVYGGVGRRKLEARRVEGVTVALFLRRLDSSLETSESNGHRVGIGETSVIPSPGSWDA